MAALGHGDQVMYACPEEGLRYVTIRRVEFLAEGVVIIDTIDGEHIEAFASEIS